MTIGCEAIKLASISASQGNLSATAKRCKLPWPPLDSAPGRCYSIIPSNVSAPKFPFYLLQVSFYDTLSASWQVFQADWSNISSILPNENFRSATETSSVFLSCSVITLPLCILQLQHCRSGPPNNSVSPLRYKFKTPHWRFEAATVLPTQWQWYCWGTDDIAAVHSTAELLPKSWRTLERWCAAKDPSPATIYPPSKGCKPWNVFKKCGATFLGWFG